MSGYSVQRYPTRSEALEAVASHLGQALESAMRNDNRVTFGVCGGRTAEALFPMLAELPLNWDSVDVLLIDERWVDTQSDQSNEKLVRDKLLQRHGSAATVVGLKTHHDSAAEALDAVERRLDQGCCRSMCYSSVWAMMVILPRFFQKAPKIQKPGERSSRRALHVLPTRGSPSPPGSCKAPSALFCRSLAIRSRHSSAG